jgi:DNA-binding SARP family transcriptional activator
LHRDGPVSRERLAFLLWPDSAERQARTNLRHVLHTLRRALPEPDRLVDVSQRTLQWRPDAPCWVDVVAFGEALARADLVAAIDVYTGDLLEGSYDEWLVSERERMRRQYLDALERLAGQLLGAANPPRRSRAPNGYSLATRCTRARTAC